MPESTDGSDGIDGARGEILRLLHLVLAWLKHQLRETVGDALHDAGPPASPWMDTKTAAAYSAIPEGTFERRAAKGHYRRYRHGKGFIFNRDELDEDLRRFSD